MTLIPFPYLFAEEERVIGDFSFERVLRNTEESISIGEIVMESRILMLLTPPT